jgi:two-component system cell cycle sensor histidine kinase/response regulator CckA
LTTQVRIKSLSPDLPTPPEHLRLLLVEDTDDDAALIVRAVKQAGYQLVVARVQTADEMRAALQSGEVDLVISDHSLPHFSSAAALACLRDRGLDLPFIVVSGTIDEESAVTILRAGAHDFVTKQNLARLGPAIRRELQEARNRVERRDALRDLRVQRDFLRLVLDTTPNLICVKDWDGRFTLANLALADLCGTSGEQLVGKRVSDFNHFPAEVAEILRTDREVMSTLQPQLVASEAATDARTGEIRWFETRRVPLVMPGSPPQVLEIGMDITERRNVESALRVSEEQLRQAQKMEAVGQLAGGIAHDFNNLLTVILGYCELLLDQIRDQPDIAADLEEIRKAGQRARSLTGQLLAFSRKQLLELRSVDLNHIVAEVERMLSRVIGEDIRLETAGDPLLQKVRADPSQIHQVLMNLAVNARDAMPCGGTLRITTANVATPPELSRAASAMTSCVALTVSDTGVGMTPEVCARIFEPFFTTKGVGKGTGLGLSMVYGVVTQSGGHIAVKSERDRGTTFTIYLPAAQEDLEQRDHTQAAILLGGTETVLLVEDEQAIRELVRKVLTGYGYDVLEAADVADAVGIADRHPNRIHLLLTDIVMPRMSGPELAQRLVPRRPDMRVLYMSGFSNGLGTSFGTTSEGVSFLSKPFTPQGLAEKVRNCLNG